MQLTNRKVTTLLDLSDARESGFSLRHDNVDPFFFLYHTEQTKITIGNFLLSKQDSAVCALVSRYNHHSIINNPWFEPLPSGAEAVWSIRTYENLTFSN